MLRVGARSVSYRRGVKIDYSTFQNISCFSWENINNLRYPENTTLMSEREELKSLLMNMKEEGEKAGLKLSIQKAKIMASSHITSWQIDGKQWKH